LLIKWPLVNTRNRTLLDPPIASPPPQGPLTRIRVAICCPTPLTSTPSRQIFLSQAEPICLLLISNTLQISVVSTRISLHLQVYRSRYRFNPILSLHRWLPPSTQTMTASKFTEWFDESTAPIYSERNVSLDGILDEMRRRSDSSASVNTSGHSTPHDSSPTSPIKTKLRRFTVGGKGRDR
jgi:hypothetical protein